MAGFGNAVDDGCCCHSMYAGDSGQEVQLRSKVVVVMVNADWPGPDGRIVARNVETALFQRRCGDSLRCRALIQSCSEDDAHRQTQMSALNLVYIETLVCIGWSMFCLVIPACVETQACAEVRVGRL